MGFFAKLFGKKDACDGKDLLCAPVAGKAVPVSEVPDPTFAEEMLGKGIAVIPSDGKVYAPAEILIHVGLETVSLKGEHFTVRAANGDKVKKGDLLIEFDLEAIKAAGFNTITPMLVCNSGDYPTFETDVNKDVTAEDVVIRLAK